MNILTKSLNERNEEANTHYLNSINTIKSVKLYNMLNRIIVLFFFDQKFYKYFVKNYHNIPFNI